MLSKNYINLIIISTSIFVFSLLFTKSINLYIHPRYELFTSIFVTIGLIFGIFSLFKTPNQNTIKLDLGTFFVTFFAVTIILIPTQVLTSSTASNRLDTLNKLYSDISKSKLDIYLDDTTKYSMGDWVKFIDQDNQSQFVGKSVKVSGFRHNLEGNNNIILLARFMITCCAVDARPVGIYVFQDKNLESDFASISENDWIEVEGKFKLLSYKGNEQLMVIPTKLKKIAIPKEPYIY